MHATPTLRTTVRALILDAHGALLLLRTHDARIHRLNEPPSTQPIWMTPGGGVQAGESLEAALTREVSEETGLTDVAWGAWRFRRQSTWVVAGKLRTFDEHYRVGVIAAVAPPLTPSALEAHELHTILGHRWWSPAALHASEEPLLPSALRTLPWGWARSEVLAPPQWLPDR